MQRLIFFVVGVLMLAIGGLVAAPLFIDLEGYKSKLTSTIEGITGLEATINGSINVTFFPSPMIQVRNLTIPNVKNAVSPSILSVQRVEVGSSFEALLQGRIDIRSISLIHPVLELEEADGGQKNWEVIMQSAQKKPSVVSASLPDEIAVRNGTIVYRSKNERQVLDFVNSDINLGTSTNTVLSFKGQFEYEATAIDYTISLGNSTESTEDAGEQKEDVSIELSSESFSTTFKGVYFKVGDEKNLSGTIEGESPNIGGFMNSFFSENTALSKINSQEKVTFSGNFALSDQSIRLSDLSINSPSIKGIGRVEALYETKGKTSINWDINATLDTINLDTLILDTPKNKSDEEEEFINYYASSLNKTDFSDFRFNIPTELSGLFNLHIKEVIYNNDTVKNIRLDTDIYEGKAAIHSLSASFPGNSKVEFIGDIAHNGIRPILNGRLDASGQKFRTALSWVYPELSFIPEDQLGEFLFTTTLTITPQTIGVSDIRISVDKTILTGNLSFRPGDNIPTLKGDIKIDRANFDSYLFTQRIDQWKRHFIRNVQHQDLESSWLRTLNLSLRFTLEATDLVYNQHPIKSFYTSLIFRPGVLKVSRLDLRSDSVNAQAKLDLSLLEDKPKLNFEMNADTFDTGLFIMPEATDNSAPATDGEKDKEQGQQTAEKDPKPQPDWLKEKFNFLGLDKVSGDIKIAFKQLKHKGFPVKNLIINGKIDKQIFTIGKLGGEFYDAKLAVNGSIGIGINPSLAISFALSNLNLAALLNVLNYEGQPVWGTFSLGGSAHTFGTTPDRWITELKTAIKISGREIAIQGFDLSSIIKSSPKLYSVIDMEEITQKALTEGTLYISALGGDILTKNGILQAINFQFSTPLSRGAFAGNMDLRSLLTKSIAQFSFIPQPKKQVNISLELSGHLKDLTKKLNTLELEKYITDKSKQP